MSSPSRRKFVDKDMDTTPENIAKFFKNYAEGSAEGNRERESSFEEGSEATAAAAAASMSGVSSLDAPSTASRVVSSPDSQPRTPQASFKKTLLRNITPLEPELPRLHSGLEKSASGENGECSQQRSIEPVLSKISSSPKRLTFKQRGDEASHTKQAAMSKQRFRELTTLIGKAFQVAKGEGILSKQAITKAVESAGVELVKGELDEALTRLDAANKIMLSDDLVICV